MNTIKIKLSSLSVMETWLLQMIIILLKNKKSIFIFWNNKWIFTGKLRVKQRKQRGKLVKKNRFSVYLYFLMTFIRELFRLYFKSSSVILNSYSTYFSAYKKCYILSAINNYSNILLSKLIKIRLQVRCFNKSINKSINKYYYIL